MSYDDCSIYHETVIRPSLDEPSVLRWCTPRPGVRLRAWVIDMAVVRLRRIAVIVAWILGLTWLAAAAACIVAGWRGQLLAALAATEPPLP
jgi:hypothetical protein